MSKVISTHTMSADLILTDQQVGFIRSFYFGSGKTDQEMIEDFSTALMLNFIEPQRFMDRLIEDYPVAGLTYEQRMTSLNEITTKLNKLKAGSV